MNNANRLPQTMVNNIKLKPNKEYNAERLVGGNAVWLVNRPAGVKIIINSTPDKDSGFILTESNRGYKWNKLGDNGLYALYDNFFLWTEGVYEGGDDDSELIEIAITSNGQIVEPILGNTADKIDRIDTLQRFAPQAQVDIYRAINESYYKNVLHRWVISGFWRYYNIATKNKGTERLYCFVTDDTSNLFIKSLGLKNEKYYKISQTGHFDIGNAIDEYGDEVISQNQIVTITSSLRLFNNQSGASFEKIASNAGALAPNSLNTNFPNLYRANVSTSTNSGASFALWGAKFVADGIHDSFAMYFEDTGLSFNQNNLIIKGEILNQYGNFALQWNVINYYDGTFVGSQATSHCSLIIEISEVTTL